MLYEVLHYVRADGTNVISDWLSKLRDKQAVVRIAARINRLVVGNFGDCKSLRGGVYELRVDRGPGYRVYFARAGKKCVLLLCGGDKRTQSADIERAVAYWDDYQQRTKS